MTYTWGRIACVGHLFIFVTDCKHGKFKLVSKKKLKKRINFEMLITQNNLEKKVTQKVKSFCTFYFHADNSSVNNIFSQQKVFIFRFNSKTFTSRCQILKDDGI